jgi:hypothetical protein
MKLAATLFCIAALTSCSGPEAEEATATKRPGAGDAGASADPSTAGTSTGVGGAAGTSTGISGETPPSTAAGCRTYEDTFASRAVVSGPIKVPLFGSMQLLVEADATVSVQSAEDSGSLSINGTVTKVEPALARSTAEKGIRAYGDPMRMPYVPTTAQAQLAGWQGLDCVVHGATALTSVNFDYKFEPALPLLVSANVDLATSGFDRSITGIRSTVVRHFEQGNGAQAGTFEGTAHLSRNGNAFKIAFDFGSGAPNMFATPFAAIEYEPDGAGGYSRITAWLWVSADNALPIELKR